MMRRVVLLGLLPAAAAAVDIPVTRLDDPLPDGCAVDDCSLREAVLLANGLVGADRIVLPASAQPYQLTRSGGDENTGLTGDLDVIGALEIAGEGDAPVVVSQMAVDRLLHLHGPGAATVLRNLHLKDGKGVSQGGAVNAENALLTVIDCSFTGNVANNGGGAIVTRGPESAIDALAATIVDSGFYANSAPQGGAVLLGGSITHGGSVTIDGSEFVGNQAVTLGGAVAVSPALGFSSELVIRDSLFYGNAVSGASGAGGAVANGSIGFVQARVEDSHLADNHAEGASARGGALSDIADIRRSRFETNVARNGGAIATFAPEIEDSWLCDNRALVDGGAVRAYRATIRRSTFCRNEAAGAGGALSFYTDADSVVRIERSTFDGNLADAGAAIWMEDGGLSLKQSTLVAPDFPPAGTLGTLIRYTGPDASPASTLEFYGNLMRGNCSFVNGPGVVNIARANVGAGSDTCGLTQQGVTFANNTQLASIANLPLLALADHGGPTPTRPPTAAVDHPALDRVAEADCIEPDQRYFQRTDAACDAGAVERSGVAPPDAIFDDGFEG